MNPLTQLNLAWRNLWRNSRRSLVTIVSLAFGFSAVALFAGYTNSVYVGLANMSIHGELIGHLSINRRGWLVQGKLDLDNRLNVEFGRYEASRLRLEDSKKSIRSETDEILQNNGSRTRLDSLFERHEQLLQDEKKLSEGLAAIQEEVIVNFCCIIGKR